MSEKSLLQKNKLWLSLLLIAVAVICCLMWYISFLPHPQGGWSSKLLTISDSLSGRLSGKRFFVYDSAGNKTWETPGALMVQDALSTDLDGDGEKDLLLLLWKIGKYGSARPFWVTEDEKAYSQHIFIYRVSDDGQVHQKWCASEIGNEIRRMKLFEKNEQLLLVEDVTGANTLWRWESFGLKILENSVTFACFGDNIIHKEIYEYAFDREGGSFDFLYEPFVKDIRAADIAVFQQETMLVDSRDAVGGYPKFGSPQEVGEAVYEAGFDIAACAGNHALDRGIYGIDVTTDFYSERGIICLGVQNSREKEFHPYRLVSKHGITFAMFDLTYGTGDMDVSDRYPYAVRYLPQDRDEEQALLDEMAEARDNSDFIIIFVHWGKEYETHANEEQRRMAGLFAEGGADVVVGTHPHVLQEVESIPRPDGGQTLVYYSLGNFRAYQAQMEETKVGGEATFRVEHTFDGVRLISHDLRTIDAFVELK
ncbi:MAG: CapA family protein [Butyrivibrio sp.]|nr:CapA family protein [Butyrivibrio sp.]